MREIQKGWQYIDDRTSVMVVPNGMVIRHEETSTVAESGIALSESMVFVPAGATQAQEWIHDQSSDRERGLRQ
jgi:hypothetical protein